MKQREEIANHVITKIKPDWLAFVRSTYPDKTVEVQRLLFANHCIEYTKLVGTDKLHDCGRFFFEQHLVTVHFPKGSHFLEDKSYRVLASPSDWMVDVCDDYTCSTCDVEVDMLTPDEAEVTRLW